MEVLYGLICLLIFLTGFYLGGLYKYKHLKEKIEKEQEERVQHLVAYWLGKVAAKEEIDKPTKIEETYSYQIVEHALQMALDSENYEEAARLRDIIQQMRDDQEKN